MTGIIAVTPDGKEHRFPAGTPQAAVDRAIKSYLSEGQSSGVGRVGKQFMSGFDKGLAFLAGTPHAASDEANKAVDRMGPLVPESAKKPNGFFDAIENTPAPNIDLSQYLPSADDFMGWMKAIGLPMEEPQSTADKFIQAGGMGATAILSPAAPIRSAIAGVSGALGGETAGQLTEGTPYEGPARLAGTLVSGGLASAGSNRAVASNAEQLASRATAGITKEQWTAAIDLQRRAAQAGAPITSAEALAQVTGGNTQLMGIQRTIENSPAAANTQMRTFMADRPAGNQAAAAQTMDQIAARQVGPTEVAPRIQAGAQGYVDDVRQGINAETRGLYTLSRDTPLPDQIFERLNADPVFQQHLAGIRRDPLLNRRIADLPDNSVGVINQVKKSMDEAQAGFASPTRETYSPERASAVEGVRNPMVQEARRASPEYDAALQTQESLRRRQLLPAERSPIGQLAQTDDVKQQAGILLPKEALKASPEQIGGTVRELVNQGETAAVRDLLRLHIQDTFDNALANVKGTGEQYRGAQFANNLRKSDNQFQSLEAAVRALPNGDTQWAGLRNLVDIFEAQGQRLPANSATSFNQQLAQGMEQNIGKGVKSLGVDMWANWNVQRRSAELARVLTDPNGVELLRQIAVLGPQSARAQQLVQAFYGTNREGARE